MLVTLVLHFFLLIPSQGPPDSGACSRHGRGEARKEVRNMNELAKRLTGLDEQARPVMAMGR